MIPSSEKSPRTPNILVTLIHMPEKLLLALGDRRRRRRIRKIAMKHYSNPENIYTANDAPMDYM